MGLRARSSQALLAVATAIGAVLSVGMVLTATASSTAHVELLVYSGRPNPDFALTVAEADELMRRLEQSPPGGIPPDAPGLGYSGLLVTLESGHVTLYHGILRERAGAPEYLRDTSGVEHWLLDIARERGHAELLAALGV